ncbi:hypothetical protein FDECE_14680 [Fusarium decemcellulare]|nr:hypothetical protein FDECE_14680 [Fusarium decemcellulare]
MTSVNGHLKAWWKEAIIYQIYPASFCDSNGDGIGDLPGIVSKLDYLKELGIDVVWICPIYDSPQVDLGYDISNYEDIYPPYGSLQDMQLLIDGVHARGMKIMLDLVINHTSDQHAWFKESRSSRTNLKSDWYIWRPPRFCPTTNTRLAPNNWRSCFGTGSAWQWNEVRQEYYLHLYAKEMPDLNWENEECRKAIFESAMETWLKKGIDGFRVDTVNLYSKRPGLPDAPIIDPASDYQFDLTVYCNGPRIHEFIGEMNAVLSRYSPITVGELPATPDPSKVLEFVRASRKQLSMVFQFDVVELDSNVSDRFDVTFPSFTLSQFKAAVAKTQRLIEGTDGWTTVFLESHDLARRVSRFAGDDSKHREHSAKMLALMQVCLTGTQFIFQGQEIGCVNAPKDSYPVENYVDINSVLYLQSIKEKHGDDALRLDKAFTGLQHLARDHARIPMLWDGDSQFGGFSDPANGNITEPWMKPHPLAKDINVKSQVKDPDSVYSFWRRALRFRKENSDLCVYANYKSLQPDDEDTMMFAKDMSQHAQDIALVILNFTTMQKEWYVPEAAELGMEPNTAINLDLVMSTYGGERKAHSLAPLEGRVYRVEVGL